jgi:rubrerythrin
MDTRPSTEHHSVEDLLRDAIGRESDLIDFYSAAARSVGNEAAGLMRGLAREHEEMRHRLELFSEDLAEQRELTSSIAD